MKQQTMGNTNTPVAYFLDLEPSLVTLYKNGEVVVEVEMYSSSF